MQARRERLAAADAIGKTLKGYGLRRHGAIAGVGVTPPSSEEVLMTIGIFSDGASSR